MKKIILAGVLSATCLFSNSFAEEDIPKWKQKQLERKAAREDATVSELPIGRVGLGFDAMISGATGHGVSVAFMVSESVKLQGVIGGDGYTKRNDENVESVRNIGFRGLFTIKRLSSVDLSGGVGASYWSTTTYDNDNDENLHSGDLVFEFPLRIEYFITPRFSASVTGGIAWYPGLFEDNNQAFFTLTGNVLGGAGVHFWM